MNFGFRIHLPFADVKLDNLYEDCEKVIVYEHPPDDEVKRLHIHGLCIGYKYKDDTLRKHFKGKYEYALTFKNKKTGGPVDETYITYMSKGEYDPLYVKNFHDDEIQLGKSLGYKPVKSDKKMSHTDKQLSKKGLSHWDVIEYVRSKALKTIVLGKDMFGYMVEKEAYADYEQIYDLLVGKLEELKIKTHQSDLERWFCTIVRNDASANAVVKDNILAKYKK